MHVLCDVRRPSTTASPQQSAPYPVRVGLREKWQIEPGRCVFVATASPLSARRLAPSPECPRCVAGAAQGLALASVEVKCHLIAGRPVFSNVFPLNRSASCKTSRDEFARGNSPLGQGSGARILSWSPCVDGAKAGPAIGGKPKGSGQTGIQQRISSGSACGRVFERALAILFVSMVSTVRARGLPATWLVRLDPVAMPPMSGLGDSFYPGTFAASQGRLHGSPQHLGAKRERVAGREDSSSIFL